jgi:Cu+-exporting ATPase
VSCSSVFVVCNALTINFFKVEKVVKEVSNIKLDIKTITLEVHGMMCEHCVKHVKDACEKVSGVSSAIPSLENNNVIIEYVGKLNIELIIDNITKAGYKVTK